MNIDRIAWDLPLLGLLPFGTARSQMTAPAASVIDRVWLSSFINTPADGKISPNTPPLILDHLRGPRASSN